MLTVAAIIEKDGKILLVKRDHDPFKFRWSLPGGHVENETAEQAVMREIKEETDLDITPKFLFNSQEDFAEYDWHATVAVFHAHAHGQVRINDESTEYGWFTLKYAAEAKLAFEHEKIIQKWLAEFTDHAGS